LLKRDDFKAICDADIESVKSGIASLSASASDTTYMAFTPSFAQASWHWTRGDYVGAQLHGKSPETKGAISLSGNTVIYWDQDFREGKLKVQRITRLSAGTVPEDQRLEEISSLLGAALAEAETWGLEKVLVWNPDELVSKAAISVAKKSQDKVSAEFGERDEASIPSLRRRGDASLEHVQWFANEYFAWC
jgi:hypothetical protein